MQGGAEWALARRDLLALGLSEIPQAARQRETTPAGRARAALALTTLPKHLPCRDAERAQINQFLEDILCPGAHHASRIPWHLHMCGVTAAPSTFNATSHTCMWSASLTAGHPSTACVNWSSAGAGDESLGKCLYISGVPGTGKTATVMEILRQARRRVEDGQLPRFQLVEINGNRLPSPYHAYTHLYEVSGCPGVACAA